MQKKYIHCPTCGNCAVVRIGNWFSLPWRRLLRRNLYVCHPCMKWWRSRKYDPSLPTESGRLIRFDR